MLLQYWFHKVVKFVDNWHCGLKEPLLISDTSIKGLFRGEVACPNIWSSYNDFI